MSFTPNNYKNKNIGNLYFDYDILSNYEDKDNRSKYLYIIELNYSKFFNKNNYSTITNKDQFFEDMIINGLESYHKNVYDYNKDFRSLRPLIGQISDLLNVQIDN